MNCEGRGSGERGSEGKGRGVKGRDEMGSYDKLSLVKGWDDMEREGTEGKGKTNRVKLKGREEKGRKVK